MVTKNDLPPVLIFAGVSGTGKTSTARVLAASLNCENLRDAEPCGECAQCLAVWNSQSNSVIEIDAASSDNVESVHKLKELTYYAHEGNWRVIILDEAHSLSEDAFNVLLKALEEPPEFTVFVLITTEVFKIPNTIRTRAMQFEFRQISYKALIQRLDLINKEQEFNAELEMLEDIAKHSKGSLRNAVMQLDQASRIGVTTSEKFKSVFGILDSSYGIVKAAIDGNTLQVLNLASETISNTGDTGNLVEELTELIRDLIVLRAHGVPQCLPSQLEERKSLALLTDDFRLVSAIKILWAAKDKVKTEKDQLTAAQVVCTLLADALKPVKPGNISIEPITTVEEVEETSLSLSEMMSLVSE